MALFDCHIRKVVALTFIYHCLRKYLKNEGISNPQKWYTFRVHFGSYRWRLDVEIIKECCPLRVWTNRSKLALSVVLQTSKMYSESYFHFQSEPRGHRLYSVTPAVDLVHVEGVKWYKGHCPIQ